MNAFGDHRTKAQLESARAIEQARLDAQIEKRWRENVATNIRRRLEKKVTQFLGTAS